MPCLIQRVDQLSSADLALAQLLHASNGALEPGAAAVDDGLDRLDLALLQELARDLPELLVELELLEVGRVYWIRR